MINARSTETEDDSVDNTIKSNSFPCRWSLYHSFIHVRCANFVFLLSFFLPFFFFFAFLIRSVVCIACVSSTKEVLKWKCSRRYLCASLESSLYSVYRIYLGFSSRSNDTKRIYCVQISLPHRWLDACVQCSMYVECGQITILIFGIGFDQSIYAECRCWAALHRTRCIRASTHVRNRSSIPLYCTTHSFVIRRTYSGLK